jgi:hypothetical protein
MQKIIGNVLIGLGLLILVVAFNADTSYKGYYNLHRASEQQNLLFLGGILFIGGIILRVKSPSVMKADSAPLEPLPPIIQPPSEPSTTSEPQTTESPREVEQIRTDSISERFRRAHSTHRADKGIYNSSTGPGQADPSESEGRTTLTIVAAIIAFGLTAQFFGWLSICFVVAAVAYCRAKKPLRLLMGDVFLAGIYCSAAIFLVSMFFAFGSATFFFSAFSTLVSAYYFESKLNQPVFDRKLI